VKSLTVDRAISSPRRRQATTGDERLPRAPDATPSVNVSDSPHYRQGPKTIIYKEALAKADVRLVGGQEPNEVLEAIRDFVRDRGYRGIEIRATKGTPPSRTALDHPMVPLVKSAVEKGFGKKVLVVPSLGGTTPDFVFTRLLGLPSIVVPLAPYDENNHAPNESTKVSLYLAGIRSGLHLIEALAK
jgi:acetylornithine deacetylase/succinyl-diaminopimelate desuccinylase-like protein